MSTAMERDASTNLTVPALWTGFGWFLLILFISGDPGLSGLIGAIELPQNPVMTVFWEWAHPTSEFPEYLSVFASIFVFALVVTDIAKFWVSETWFRTYEGHYRVITQGDLLSLSATVVLTMLFAINSDFPTDPLPVMQGIVMILMYIGFIAVVVWTRRALQLPSGTRSFRTKGIVIVTVVAGAFVVTAFGTFLMVGLEFWIKG